MNRIWKIGAGFALLCAIVSAPAARAQGGPGNLPPVLGPSGAPKGGATITVCNYPATGLPCTNLATIYSDIQLTQPINQTTNPLKTDGLGNVPAFFAAPGSYTYTVSGVGISSPQGPYVFVISCIPGTTCVAASANNTFTGNNTHSGTETFSGAANLNGGGALNGNFSGPTTLSGNLTATAGQNQVNAYGVNGTIVVDGCASPAPTSPKYACTAAGIQAAINQANSNGGGEVFIPSTNGVPVPMGNTSVSIFSLVHVRGAGWGSTILQWTSAPAAAGFVFSNTHEAMLSDLQMQFPAGAVMNGIKAIGSDASQFFDNTIQNIFINCPTACGNGSAAIWGQSTGPSSADIVLNHFINILVWQTDQAVLCNGCEGNYWDITAQRIGTQNNSIMFQETAPQADDIIIARMANASSTGNVCYQTAGSNNLVRLTCDTSPAGTALNDIGGHNIFDVDLIGLSTLGTVATTSQYRSVASSGAVQSILATPQVQFPEVAAPSGSAGNAILYADSTAHALKASYNNDSFLTLPRVVASGTATMTTAAIASGACGATVTVSASGVQTTDTIETAFNAAVGANPGTLTLQKWVTANNVNFAYCNPTAGSITPTAATVNWRVVR